MKSDLHYWTDFARKAEAEIEAATGRTALNAASKKLMMARRELKRLEQVTRRASGGAASAASA